MRNYIILNGTNSNTIAGLLIQELAPISKPLMRTEIEEIDGRDGDIITPLGFSAYDKQITIGLYGTYDINAIIAFFNSEGTVTFSNEPDKYYNYQIYDQIDFERLVRFKTATVTLHCQPFKFATTGESQTLSSGNPISDEGTNLVLEGSQLAPFSQFDLKGNTEQSGTPAPDAPVPVKVVTGANEIRITGVNLFNGTIYKTGCIISDNGSETAIAGYVTTTEFPVEPNTSYTASGTFPASVDNYIRVAYYDSSMTFIRRDSIAVPYTGTSPSNAAYARLSYYNAGTKIQFEKGSEVTEYFEPQIYRLDLINGSNLFDKDNPNYYYGYMDGSTMKLVGSGVRTLYVQCDPNTEYTIVKSAIGTNNRFCVFTTAEVPADGVTALNYVGTPSGEDASTSYTIRTPSTAAYLCVFFRTSGTTPTLNEQLASIQIASPIELCEIDINQDNIYPSEDKWYKHKAIGKTILPSSDWVFRTDTSVSGCSVFRYAAYGAGLFDTGSQVLSSHFRGVQSGNIADTLRLIDLNGYGFNIVINNSAVGIESSDSSATKQTKFMSWLANNAVSVYYILKTPVDEQITNGLLIEQLNNIADQAHAYKTRTHVSSTYATGNVPHIIAATVVGSADGTVTNAGNIYSKPKLTIYGSGDVGVYLNGVQMLQIALGTLGNITIDTDLMEAYTGTIDNLQNRAVTGDYSNFKLAVGANKISFSGSVTSCIVENFSRWL